MAKFLSSTIGQVSGSTGGTTYSRNKGGQYIRARAVPTQPRTTAQVAQRSALGSASQLWASISAEARALWTSYAALIPRVDSLGQTIQLTGQQVFIGGVSLLHRNGMPLDPALDGPDAQQLIPAPVILPPDWQPSDTPPHVDFTGTGTLNAGDPAESVIVTLRISRAQNASNTSAHQPLQLVGSSSFAPTGTTPADWEILNVLFSSLPWPYTAGQNYRLIASSFTPDGRYSPDREFVGVVS